MSLRKKEEGAFNIDFPPFRGTQNQNTDTGPYHSQPLGGLGVVTISPVKLSLCLQVDLPQDLASWETGRVVEVGARLLVGTKALGRTLSKSMRLKIWQREAAATRSCYSSHRGAAKDKDVSRTHLDGA